MSTWSERHFDWSIKDVGAPLLESITASLYSRMEVFREYVQNAIDAYVDFQKLTGLDPMNSVQVGINPDDRSLIIRDDGVGMDWDDLLTAKSVAVTSKLGRSIEFVGFRGIGIWSGLSVCDELVLTTTKVGVPIEFKLVINCRDIVEHFREPIPIDDLLEGRVKIFERSTDEEKHYTHVKLSSIHSDYSDLLDAPKVTEYAEQHLPVPFDPHWGTERNNYAQLVEAALDGVEFSATYPLTINGQPVFRRFPGPADVNRPEREVIKDAAGHEIGIAWFCETARRSRGSKAIDKRSGVRSFAVRVKNFAIGERGLYSHHPSFADLSLLDWYVGEIYITDPDIQPDTKRTSFQPSAHHDAAVDAIRKFYVGLSWRARALSAQLAAVEKCTGAQEKSTELETALSSRLFGDGATAEVRRLWQDLLAMKGKIDKIREDANTSSSGQEAPSTAIERKYLRKPDVTRAVDTALAKISALEPRVEQYLQESRIENQMATSTAIAPVPAPAAENARRNRSKSLTTTLSGRVVNPAAALNAVTTVGSQPESQAMPLVTLPLDEAQNGREDPDAYSINLSTVTSAFQAAAMAVLGEHSEAFRRLMERLLVELQRRGIDV